MPNSLPAHGLQHARLPCPSLELAQTHVHWVSDAIPPSHPLLSPSPPAFNLSQHQGLFPVNQFFASGSQSIWVSASASVLPMNIQDWLPFSFCPRDAQDIVVESNDSSMNINTFHLLLGVKVPSAQWVVIPFTVNIAGLLILKECMIMQLSARAPLEWKGCFSSNHSQKLTPQQT